jgi:hypothetical protein
MSHRSVSFRKTRPGVVLLGEGLTEQCYFQHLKRIKGLHCTVEPRLHRNTTILSFEKKIKELIQSDIDVICVFDADVAQTNHEEMRRLKKFREQFGNHPKVTICDSLPSIEYWFLLHFQDGQGVAFNADTLLKALKKHIGHYDKTRRFLQNEKWVQDMTEGEGSLDQAMKRAEHAATLDRPSHCPNTNIHLGIKLLMGKE